MEKKQSNRIRVKENGRVRGGISSLLLVFDGIAEPQKFKKSYFIIGNQLDRYFLNTFCVQMLVTDVKLGQNWVLPALALQR